MNNDAANQYNQLLRDLDIDIQEIKKAARKGIYLVIHEMEKRAIENIASKANVTSSNTNKNRTDIGKFGIPLIRGIRAFLWKGQDTATIHAFGNLGENDGTWRLRFFETGTSKRWQKKKVWKNGIMIKKRVRSKKGGTKYLGQMKARPFLEPAVNSVNSESIIDKSIIDKINEINSQS